MKSLLDSGTSQRPSVWRYISWPSLVFSAFGTSFFAASAFCGEAMARAVGVRKDIPLAVGMALMLLSSLWVCLSGRRTSARVMADWDKLTQTDEMEYDFGNLARIVKTSSISDEFQSLFSICASMLMIGGIYWKQPLTQLLGGSELAVFLLTVVPTIISCVWMYRTNKHRKAHVKDLRAEVQSLEVAAEGVKRRRDP